MKNCLQEAGKLQLSQEDLVNGACATSLSARQSTIRVAYPQAPTTNLSVGFRIGFNTQ